VGPKLSENSLVLVGRFGAAHGVRGEIRLKSFTGDPGAIADYGPLSDSAGKRSFTLKTLRHVKDDIFVVRVDGVSDRTAAEALTNLDLFVARDRLPEAEDEEFYNADLIGLAAVTESGEVLGTVTAMLNFGAGDIVEVAPPAGQTLLFPFTKAIVPTVDIPGKRLVIVPPEEVDGEERSDADV